MPGCYARTIELDIVRADHESFTKQHDNNCAVMKYKMRISYIILLDLDTTNKYEDLYNIVGLILKFIL